jgi:antibiotic biosynthesis monooxygenase (ABM) superfamily enzyme
MWLLSSIAIYPLITLSELSQAGRFAITTPILGALVTWLVMPLLSRLFKDWLYA